jgi:hypothetical protein
MATENSEGRIIIIFSYFKSKIEVYIKQGCTNPRRQISLAPNILNPQGEGLVFLEVASGFLKKFVTSAVDLHRTNSSLQEFQFSISPLRPVTSACTQSKLKFL